MPCGCPKTLQCAEPFPAERGSRLRIEANLALDLKIERRCSCHCPRTPNYNGDRVLTTAQDTPRLVIGLQAIFLPHRAELLAFVACARGGASRPTPLNAPRGEWQLSRVYSVLGRAEPALHHARRTLELSEQHGYGDFDLAFAYEALARAHAVAGDRAGRDRYFQKGLEAAEGIEDKEDRDLFLSDLNSVP